MTAAVHIRRATSSDAGSVQQCVEQAYAIYIERMRKRPGPMLQNYASVIASNKVYLALGSTGIDSAATKHGNTDRLLAVLVLCEWEKGMLLDNIAVAPEAQGQGLGRRMMALAETETREAGYSELHLYTHILMVENIALYLHLGYQETERKQVNGFDRVYMKKRLF